MNKYVIPIFTIFISIALLQTCVAKTAPISARFDGTAVGECLVLIGGILGPQPPVANFIGEGAIRIRGSCAFDEYSPDAIYYAAEGAKASGILSAEWNDQKIRVSIHSEDDTCGFFIDQGDANYFTVGILPGDPLWASSLTYIGVYEDQTGTSAISGKCGVFAVPIGPSDPSNIMAMGAGFFKQDATPLLTIIWVPIDLPLGPPASLLLHAADQFMHNVEIITKP